MHPLAQQQLYGQLLGNPMFGGQPFSQMLGAPAMMDPMAMRAMQQEMQLRQYDAMMRRPQPTQKKKPPAELQGQLFNPFAVIGDALSQ